MLFELFQAQPVKEFLFNPPGSMFFILFLALGISLISAGLTKWLTDTAEMERKQRQIKAHEEEKEKIIELAETNPNKYRKERKRWERKDEMLKKTQQGMAMQRLKPTCITSLPMIIFFIIIRTFFINNPVALTAMNANDVPLIGGILQASNGSATEGSISRVLATVIRLGREMPNLFSTDQLLDAYFTLHLIAEPWTEAFYGLPQVISGTDGWINFTTWYFLCSFGMNTLVQRFLGIQTQASGGMGQMMGGSKAKTLEFPDI
ncbi:MAG: hypothetical protein BAJALOKI1v1_130037 [Promethearchaeota archaeon]|nr:MAG: hypothetical protein BAJALOKI1v1_130037 [Candidatus Lokiarchaeota archaeon]